MLNRFVSLLFCFAFICCTQTVIADKKPYPHRMVWMWENMDAGLLHSSQPSFFSKEDISNPTSVPRYVRFAKFLQSLKINELCISVSFNDHSFLDITSQLRVLSEFLHDYGITMFLHIPYGYYAQKAGNQKFPNCPFQPEFEAYWNKLANKLFSEIPLLGGYVMKGTGYEGIPGPINCNCKICKSKSDDERIIRAFEILADSIADYDGLIFYRTWTTGAMQDAEYQLFKNVAGRLPDNLLIVSKKGYGDFLLNEFPHPLFGHVHPESKHIAEFQIFGEYRGNHYMPCQMVTRWRKWLDENAKKIGGLIGIAEVGRNAFDHPLNMVNWYAFGAYASNPSAQPDDIFCDWATKTYGENDAPYVIEIAKKTDEQVWKLMYFKGVWIQNHSFLPSRNYLDIHLRGPWVGLPRNNELFGWGRPLHMYTRKKAAQYEANTDMQLFLNRVPITSELLDSLMDWQNEAVMGFEESINYWNRHRPNMSRWTYLLINNGLEKNLVDANIWRLNTALYLHWLQEKDYSVLLDEMEEMHSLIGSPLTQSRINQIIRDYREQMNKE